MAVKRLGPAIVMLTLFLVLIGSSAAGARENFRGMTVTLTRSMPVETIEASKETCLQCHSRVTPMIVAQHKTGAHARAGLNCADCHGSDHRNMPIVTGKKVCGKCHEQQTREMLASKHANSWNNMWNNARYFSQPQAIQQQGCARCHDISTGFNDVLDVRCDYCHSTHEFSVKEARSPAACTTCHMGPDHPQAEAFAASGHGRRYNADGSDPDTGGVVPTCITCHQPGGSHNVSGNIGLGGVSNGAVLKDWDWVMDTGGMPRLKRPVITQAQFQQARTGNLAVCNKCHAEDFNRQWLEGADQIKQAVDRQLLEAQQLVEALNKEGLLDPVPAVRPANPVEGRKLVLGGNQLYSGTSKAESIYFRMYKFAAAQGWKSAYHQDFQRAGVQGFGEMKKLMAELQAEADLLRLLGPAKTTDEKTAQAVTDQAAEAPDYLLYALGGVMSGGILAVVVYWFRNRKGGKKASIFTGVFILALFCSGLTAAPQTTQAWGTDPTATKQCQSCHQDHTRQLKSGKHRTLQCLDCHQPGAGVNQVRQPLTCGRCHNEEKDFQQETYSSSSHGVQYQIKGVDPWAPTCATCHMPGGGHNPISKLGGEETRFRGGIGAVCLKCHTTDHVLKFSQDLAAINKQADDLTAEVNRAGLDLIDRKILLPTGGRRPAVDQLKENWAFDYQWELTNIKDLSPQEQEQAQRLVAELVDKTVAATGDARKMRSGAAHVNPDFTHWYGNAYLNLDLSEAKGTAKELEMLAVKAGYIPETEDRTPPGRPLLLAFVTAAAGFGLVTLVLTERKRNIDF